MPRHKGSLLKGGHSLKSKKIIIKPFRKPPALPAKYYETTAEQLLTGTLEVLKMACALHTTASSSHQQQQQQQQQQPVDMAAVEHNLSLQNSYTSVVNLVSHQYGPRLYQDLVASMQQAAAICLPAPNDQNGGNSSNSSHGGSNSSNELLATLPAQYQLYTDYLLLCRSVFLPLDRTHYWLPAEQRAIPSRQAATSAIAAAAQPPLGGAGPPGHGSTGRGDGSTNTSSQQQKQQHATSMAAAAAAATQNIWQAGLSQFAARLHELQLDTRLYQEWLSALLQDWNPSSTAAAPLSLSSSMPSTPTTTTTNNNNNNTTAIASSPSSLSSRQNLQAVWYLWQDLGLLSVLPLHRDLQDYWTRQSKLYQQQQPYKAAAFLQFAAAKHKHVRVWAPWLPSAWLCQIIEVCLFQPHLLPAQTASPPSSSTMTTTTIKGMAAFTTFASPSSANAEKLLLAEQHLYPLLSEQVFSSSREGRVRSGTSSDNNSTSAVNNVSQQQPIQQLWMLAGRLPGGQKAVAAAIQTYARNQGLQRVRGQQQAAAAATTTTTRPAPTPQQAVPDLLHLQDCLSRMIAVLPNGTDLINLKSVWEEVVNADVQPCLAEQLAKYLDVTLRSTKRMDLLQQQQQQQQLVPGMMNASSTAAAPADAWLAKIVAGLFVPLQAKDIFEAFYKRDLAKRLLWNRVVSMDVEKQVCSLLKAECGAGYTSKMEGMFQDVDFSKETMMVYKQSCQKDSQNSSMATSVHPPVEMEVQVLTTGYWPVYPQFPSLQLPESLKAPQDAFAAHYKAKYQGRRMAWQYALGHCIVRCTGFAKPYDLVVSLCQALVVVQFTSDETVWTLPGLMRTVGLEDRGEMERILLSLSLGKEGTRILRKRDHDGVVPAATAGTADASKKTVRKKIRNTVHDLDEFRINTRFESNQRRIRITNIMMKETSQERQKTVEAVSRDRLYLIDAVLVRIMKARKTILHQQLLPAVLEQLKVPATAADVKKRIESLIERDYMERDHKDRNRYNYLA